MSALMLRCVPAAFAICSARCRLEAAVFRRHSLIAWAGACWAPSRNSVSVSAHFRVGCKFAPSSHSRLAGTSCAARLDLSSRSLPTQLWRENPCPPISFPSSHTPPFTARLRPTAHLRPTRSKVKSTELPHQAGQRVLKPSTRPSPSPYSPETRAALGVAIAEVVDLDLCYRPRRRPVPAPVAAAAAMALRARPPVRRVALLDARRWPRRRRCSPPRATQYVRGARQCTLAEGGPVLAGMCGVCAREPPLFLFRFPLLSCPLSRVSLALVRPR